jgi:hypothetical protein
MSNNPFGEIAATKQSGLVAEQSRSITEVQAQVVLARQFPRDPIISTDKILKECQRITLAEQAVYSYPRGGQEITGPSIRLAEAIIRSWGNCLAGITEVDRNNKESSMLAYAWDLETNTMIRKEFKVPHTRDTKQGKKELTDDRDVYEVTANQGARRLRACILGLIPGDLVDAAVSECKRTLTASIGNTKEAIEKMVTAFQTFGVTRQMIEKRLQHRIESTQAAEIIALRSVYNSIKDKMGSVEDYFETDKKPENVVKLAENTKEKADFTLEFPLSAQEMIAQLDEWSHDETLPVPALEEIKQMLESGCEDANELNALLNKIKILKK